MELAAATLLASSRESVQEDAPLWGAFRSDEDQRRAQREMHAFEVMYYLKEGNEEPYNYWKWRSDWADYWLCGYCAAGYTVVTSDERLLKSFEGTGCKEVRVVSVEEGLVRAESWLAHGR